MLQVLIDESAWNKLNFWALVNICKKEEAKQSFSVKQKDSSLGKPCQALRERFKIFNGIKFSDRNKLILMMLKHQKWKSGQFWLVSGISGKDTTPGKHIYV